MFGDVLDEEEERRGEGGRGGRGSGQAPPICTDEDNYGLRSTEDRMDRIDRIDRRSTLYPSVFIHPFTRAARDVYVFQISFPSSTCMMYLSLHSASASQAPRTELTAVDAVSGL